MSRPKDEALVTPQWIIYWACQGGRDHPTTVWLRQHLSQRRLYLVRRLGEAYPGDRDHYAILLCQLQVCGRIVDLEVHETEWAPVALQSQIREKAAYN